MRDSEAAGASASPRSGWLSRSPQSVADHLGGSREEGEGELKDYIRAENPLTSSPSQCFGFVFDTRGLHPKSRLVLR